MQLLTSVERVVSRDNTRIDTVNTHNRRSSGYSHKCNYCNSSVLNFCHDLKCYLTNWLSDNKMSPTEEFTVFGFKSPIFGLVVWYPLEHHASTTYNIHSVHAAWELIYSHAVSYWILWSDWLHNSISQSSLFKPKRNQTFLWYYSTWCTHSGEFRKIQGTSCKPFLLDQVHMLSFKFSLKQK